MKRELKVKKGDEYLPKYPVKVLEEMHVQLPRGKPRQRVWAAVLRKKGCTCEEIGVAIGEKTKTVYDWLQRLAEGGMCRIYDTPSPGRPCKLSNDELYRLDLTVRNGPQSVGCSRENWTSGKLAEYVEKETGQAYSKSGILKLTSKMGYSWRVPRPVPYNSATPEEQEKFKEETKREMDEHREAGYKICSYDACAKKDSPTAQRGIRTRGGSETVSTNYSKKSIQILGVLGENTLDIMFSRTYKLEDTIRMIDHVYKKYGKLYILLDNAGANSSAKVKNYVEDMNGEVVLKYNLPHTPQLNPIEPQWLVIKGAVGGAYFGDFKGHADRHKECLGAGGDTGGAPVRVHAGPRAAQGSAPRSGNLHRLKAGESYERGISRHAPGMHSTLAAQIRPARHARRHSAHARMPSAKPYLLSTDMIPVE